MKTYFLDTSFLVALVLTADQNHTAAQSKWQELTKRDFSLMTTSYVFDETATYLNSRGQHEKAVEVGEKILLSRLIELVHVDEDLFFEGWAMFRKHQDKSYSLTDCISFIVMRQNGLDAALTFDKDFKQAGFKIET